MIFTRQQLKKELRPLLLPGAIAVLGGALIGLEPLLEGSGLEGLLVGVAFYAFFGGLVLLATTTFGTELHERTLVLLLSQPIPRARLWAQKMIALTIGTLAVVLVEIALLAGISGCYSGDEISRAVHEALAERGLAFCSLFLLTTACSCGFWTLGAGSTIAGVVFTICGQFLTVLAAAFLAARIYAQQELFQDARTFPVVVAASLIYSSAFQYLGWRKFARLELIGTGSTKPARSARLLSWRPAFLQSRPRGAILNLVRKEIRLQKTIVQLALLFTLCWFVILTMQLLRPGQKITYLFDIVTSLYAPVGALLAGCIPLGEEKNLGLTGAQLVLPVPPWLQWSVKLVVSMATAAALCLGLPLLLFSITGKLVSLDTSGLMSPQDNGMLALAIISGMMFLLGYWAITLTTRTVQAALVAIFAVILLPTCAAVAMRCARMWFGWPETGLNREQLALSAAAAAASILLLGQSLIQFCQSERREKRLFLYSTSVIALVILVSFLATCIG